MRLEAASDADLLGLIESEETELRLNISTLQKSLVELLRPKTVSDSKSVIIECRAGSPIE